MKRPSPGDVIAQHYRLIRVLGEGSSSLVFAAENVFTGRFVALKWLLPERLREREVSLDLLREAQRNGAVLHPNVVNVTDVGRHAGSLFLVMELLQGKPLSALLTDAPVDPHAFLKLMMPVLRGLQAAHDAGIVHRDLGPDKVFVCVDAHGLGRNIKVLDFGVAKLTHASSRRGQELVSAGSLHTTPQFLAPEQLHDPRDCDQRSDIYALGVILYRALSGAYPFDGETLSELAILVCDGKAIPLHQRVPRLPRGLSSVVMRTLERDPKQRYESVTDLISALEPYLPRREASRRALLHLTEPDVPRPESLAQDADRRALRDLVVRSTTPTQGRVRGLSPASGRLRPPPPPMPRHPTIVDHDASTLESPPSQRRSDSHEPLPSARRPGAPIKSRLALPPLPPMSSTHSTDPLQRMADGLTSKATVRADSLSAGHRAEGDEQKQQQVVLAAAAKQL
jgi:serine/threonine protein kinase